MKMNLIKSISKWLRALLSCTALVSLLWGCAVAPTKLLIKDISKSFEENTIISADTGMLVSFEELLEDLNRNQVAYIGEKHTNRSHHKIQAKVIQAMFQKSQNIAVAMEMFAYTYQDVIDLWSAGELDEKTFLRKSHWYAGWRYDFSLYRDILEFIKANRIRLVALNIPFDIPAKIRVGGIENLAEDDKAHIPKEIDTSNTAYRDYVESVFKKHNFKGKFEFDDFYMVQSVWDEKMAESIAVNLNQEKMVVLAGNGHIQYKYGIPDRAFRRTGASFRTLYLAPADEEVDLSIADYIWITP